jgi:hypothetical protein
VEVRRREQGAGGTQLVRRRRAQPGGGKPRAPASFGQGGAVAVHGQIERDSHFPGAAGADEVEDDLLDTGGGGIWRRSCGGADLFRRVSG